MRGTCLHAARMSKMIQLRNVPVALHSTLKARAAMAGMSLSDYLRKELEVVAARPTIAELRERLNQLPPVTVRETPERAVRRERDRR